MYTREEFELLRKEKATKMAADLNLKKSANNILSEADKYYWLHQPNWFGEPCIQLPQDMMAFQEIIFKTKPKFIIEVGVAWAGSLLYYSTIINAMGGGQVVGVDIYIPQDLKERISKFGKISESITLIEGSSIEQSTFEKVKKIVGDCKEVLIILDSNHTHQHVLEELNLYSQLVGKGYYLVCGDTIVEDIPPQDRDRPWGPGNNPKTALWEFLKKTTCFKIDNDVENKLLFTCNPSGYLIRTEN